jgi:hypothetical protein
MAIFEQDEVRSVLEPIHDLIAKVVELAHREHLAAKRLLTNHGFPSHLYSRTSSNELFDAVARHAITILGADARVLVHAEAQTVKFSVGGKAVFKFKKGDEDKLTCNHPTQAVRDFHDPDAPVGMGLPPETAKIEIVWLPNAAKTGYLAIFAVARDQDDVLWDYEIPRWAGEQNDGIFQFPRSPKDDSDQDDLSNLIAPKKPDDQSERDE